MEFNTLSQIKILQKIEEILHIPGNYTGGPLEMAFVVDGALPLADAKRMTAEIMKHLKLRKEVFRNVRFNLVFWKNDTSIVSNVVPIPMLIMGKGFDSYEQITELKKFTSIIDYLKMYQARSKLVLFLTNGAFPVDDREDLINRLKPFLFKKMLLLLTEDQPDLTSFANNVTSHIRLLRI